MILKTMPGYLPFPAMISLLVIIFPLKIIKAVLSVFNNIQVLF